MNTFISALEMRLFGLEYFYHSLCPLHLAHSSLSSRSPLLPIPPPSLQSRVDVLQLHFVLFLWDSIFFDCEACSVHTHHPPQMLGLSEE